jgi:hypothetical protein
LRNGDTESVMHNKVSAHHPVERCMVSTGFGPAVFDITTQTSRETGHKASPQTTVLITGMGMRG